MRAAPTPVAQDAHAQAPIPQLPQKRPMRGRDIHEAHRAASPLELLFDLTTVVAVAAVAARLHHDVAAGHYMEASFGLVFSFFAVWWSWVNFTWFSSAYDTDDVTYRLSTLVQMAGMLLMTAGLRQGDEGPFTVTMGYSVMRLAMIALWLRAAREHADRRSTCLRYALGLGLVQVLWLVRATLLPQDDFGWMAVSFVVLGALEMVVPAVAERLGGTPWHPHHIAERYSLLTIILLGECMVGAGNAMGTVLAASGWSLDLAMVAVAIVGLIGGLWWVYFLVPFAQVLHSRRERSFLWGYGHALVFVALAALSGGLEVVADLLKAPDVLHGAVAGAGADHHGATPVIAMAFVAGAVLMFLVMLWWLGTRTTRRLERSFAYLLPSGLVAAVSVAAVAMGLSLAWGMLILSASPALLIMLVMRQRQRQPDRFAVR